MTPAAFCQLTTAHKLTCETLQKLWDEVRAFWRGRDMSRAASAFAN